MSLDILVCSEYEHKNANKFHCSAVAIVKKNYSNKEELNLALITKLKDKSNFNQRDLAKQLNVSLGGLNYCLKALVEKGFVKVKNFKNSKNKMSYAYILTSEGLAEKIKLTKKFLIFKYTEYEKLEKEIKNLEQELGSGNEF
tara:strand:- start:153 stop:578 length:426 start_codon:yes stop_codon:yes gene_type:complete